jgi:hypothetical protein
MKHVRKSLLGPEVDAMLANPATKRKLKNQLGANPTPDEIWQDGGMPAFDQRPIKVPYHQMIVRTRNPEDLQKLAELLGQPIHPSTKAVWWPPKLLTPHVDRRVVHEDDTRFDSIPDTETQTPKELWAEGKI